MKNDSTVALVPLQWKGPPTTGGDTVTLTPLQGKGLATGNDTITLAPLHWKGPPQATTPSL